MEIEHPVTVGVDCTANRSAAAQRLRGCKFPFIGDIEAPLDVQWMRGRTDTRG